jgi:hypothetical protein
MTVNEQRANGKHIARRSGRVRLSLLAQSIVSRRPPQFRLTSPWHYALNQGQIVLMIENCHTRLIWRLMRECAPIKAGLLRAGFGSGRLDATPSNQGKAKSR